MLPPCPPLAEEGRRPRSTRIHRRSGGGLLAACGKDTLGLVGLSCGIQAWEEY